MSDLTLDQLRAGFAEPSAEARPMMRWWWFGPHVDRAELDRELVAMAAAGIGGVEISYVYPLSTVADTSGIADAFGSEEFRGHLRYAAERARELGLRFDLTLGSGWSFGGPHVTADLAARRLHWERREIGGTAMDVPVVSPWPGDQLVAAFVGNGSIQESPEELAAVPVEDETIRVPAGSGPRVVLLAYSRLTGQNVKRAAAGAEGPVLDHYSVAAAEEHIAQVAEPLLTAVSSELIGSVFCDSLEVYGSDWTPALPEEFERRRGYPLLPRLPLLHLEGAGSATLRADFYRTLSELYEENFVAVFQRWSAGHGVPFRIQSYGVPPATVSSYRHADICEGEGWDWRGIPQTRWASSAAHLYDREVVSAEVWTWVHSPSFRATPLDLKGEAHEHLLAGVNHLIGHGWPYSPSKAPGLGWFFYAAGALDDRNPWWPAMQPLAGYLQRLCWLLRQGDPVADVQIYVPASDVYAAMGTPAGTLDLWKGARDHIGADVPRIVRESGLDFDLVDDDAIRVVGPDDGRIVVLPYVTALPPETRQWLSEIIAAGGTVIAVGGSVDVAGAVSLADTTQLSSALLDARPADIALEPHLAHIGVVHRRLAEADVYLVANTGATTGSFRFTSRTTRTTFEEWDAASGAVRRSGPVGAGVDLTLHAYEATVIILSDIDASAESLGRSTQRARIPLDRDWTVTFLDDATERSESVTLPHRWEDTDVLADYSGAARYATTLDVAAEDLDGTRLMIDFGTPLPTDSGATEEAGIRGNAYRVMVKPPIGEMAEVIINGSPVGIVWDAPYAIDVTDQLRPGPNELTIVVRNTAANALSADPHIDDWVAESVRRYGRRFRMQELEKARDGLASGLLSVPTLIISESTTAELARHGNP